MSKAAPAPQSAKEISTARLAPIAAWAKADANRGAINALTERVAQLSGGDVTRHMISRWLNGQVQPTHGYGILLETAYEQLISEA
jgi:hypothetical protein